MFKQLSQLGRNLNDEFSKGISEDLSSSKGQSSKGDSVLPSEVISKLRKFEKYEDKYPKLLAAYKGEKLKLEKVAEIERVLSEYTPISNFDDVESLGSFFKDMKERQDLLNNEIKRLLAENPTKDLDEEKQSLMLPSSKEKDEGIIDASHNKVEVEEPMASNEQELNKLREELLATNKAFENLQNEKDTLITSNKEHISHLQEELTGLKATYDGKEKSNDEIIESLKSKNESLARRVDELVQNLAESESMVEGLQTQIGKSAGENGELESKVGMPTNNTSNPSSAFSKSAFKKKKKNNKKKSSVNIGNTNEEHCATEVGDEVTFESRYKEVCAELEFVEVSLRADWEGRCDALEAELKISSQSESNLKEKLGELECDYKKLENELHNSRVVIKEKEYEIEETKDMMKTIGNELVGAKDKLKGSSHLDEEDLINLKNELRETRTQLSSVIKKSANKEDELNSSLCGMNKELETLKATLLSDEKQRHLLEEHNNKLTEQMNEHENLKRTHLSLKTLMGQKEKTIVYLEQQVKTYSENIDTAKKAADSIRVEHKQSLALIENLKSDYEILQLEIKAKNESLEKYIKENGQFSERLSVLNHKYELLQDLKSNSSEQTDSIRRQCEELTVKLRESNKKILSLEDEVAEYSNVIHEKTREISNIHRRISEHSNDETAKERELKERLTCETDEKIKLQEELTLQATKKLRDVQYLKQANSELKSELRRSQLKERELQADIVALESLNVSLKNRMEPSKEDSNELEMLAGNLKHSLSRADQKIREVQETNENLMRTNEDVNEKLRRLSKNYKTLSKQLSELKEMNRDGIRSSWTGSGASNVDRQLLLNSSSQSLSSDRSTFVSETASEMNEKVAYIKNVLLGFLEHKDQRTQLLPVVSTLLRFDSNDERRLMMSLK